MRKGLIVPILILVAILIGILAYGYWNYGVTDTAGAVPASTETVSPAAAQITAEGTILPRQYARLAFMVGGRVTEVPVQEGEKVWGQQVLARLDDTTLANQEAQAEAALDVAQKQLALLRAGALQSRRQAVQDAVTAAQAKYDDARAVGNATGIKAAAAALSEAKSALAALDPSPEQLAIAQAQVTQADAALAAAKSARQEAVLHAPFAGTIAQVNLNPGDFVTPGLPMIVIGDLSSLRVETNDISDLDIGRVQVGQPVAITVDALPGQLFHGLVASISPMATESRGYQVFRLWVDVQEGVETGLRWGMSAKVHFAELPQQ